MKKSFKAFIAFIILVVTLLVPAQSVYAEDGSLDRVQEKGQLVIGTSGDFPPFEFYAEVDGEQQLVGMDMSIARKIADDMGVELVIRDMEFDSLIPALEANNIDMIVAGMTPTAERRQSVNFSDIYYQTFQNIMVQAEDEAIYDSVESLRGQKVGVQTASLQEQLAEQIPDVELMQLGNINDLILALQTNRIEAIVMQGPNAVAHAENDSTLYTFEGDFELDEEDQGSAIAMRMGEDSLAAAVNESLGEILDQNLIEEYLGTAGEYMAGTSEEDVSENFLGTYWTYFADGMYVTILISVISVLVGMVLGFLLSLMRLTKNVVIRFLASSYVEFVRGTPLLIQVMFIYFGAGVFFDLPALTAGIIAVSLNSGAYICEIIRGGLNSVDSGQSEAARSLGMSKNQTMRYILFPQALKNIWPALGNEFITIIKESSIVSVIGVSELIFQTRIVRSTSFRGILPLFITMLIYFFLTFTLTKILNYFEGRMNHD
ncbi:ABC transporter substrate-binding protein/permease [Marinilactibacillus sp. XAAS-LB27]|uniref:ABC transporter substrate-binding protein/permease n=1 Tax=Marinilactibacillus sp. XAAS-LB27 TaxID=3114538 RepID=UPI002E185F9A|nr:ABC transporter substrate-binding protein/permease [Marinilactibacillus sp. XAAS-LB27]